MRKILFVIPSQASITARQYDNRSFHEVLIKALHGISRRSCNTNSGRISGAMRSQDDALQFSFWKDSRNNEPIEMENNLFRCISFDDDKLISFGQFLKFMSVDIERIDTRNRSIFSLYEGDNHWQICF